MEWVFNLISNLKGTGEVRHEIVTIDPSYGIDFVLIQGFIELAQNAFDARDELSLKGVKAKADIFVHDGVMYFANYGSSIDIADFYPGKSTKREDIAPCLPRGYFGTGLAKSTVLLLRNGYRIKAYTYYGLFEPMLAEKKSEKYGVTEVLDIKVTDLRTPEPATIIAVTGAKLYDIYEELKSRMLDLKKVARYRPEKVENVELVLENIPSVSKISTEEKVMNRGYHRGIYVCDINSIFSYNFCSRELMTQESRNAFTKTYLLGSHIARVWNYCDDIDLIKNFTELRRNYSGECLEDEFCRYWSPPYHSDLWKKAWKMLYGEKYVTSIPMVAAKYPDKFELVPEPLYVLLKSVGVPTEAESEIESVSIVPYTLTDYERKKLDNAIKIASFIAGKRVKSEVSKIYSTLSKYLHKHVYSRAVVIDKNGKETDKTEEAAFTYDRDIRMIYIRDQTVRERDEIGIAVVLIHELAHTKEVGALYRMPSGFAHENMHYYYEQILVDLIQYIGLDKILELAEKYA